MSSEPIVFVVDDDEAVRESLRDLISSAGLGVRTLESGQAFLDQYRNEPGCLVLDIRMRDLSGLQLQKVLNERGVAIPIIFITGHGDIPMAVEAMREGAIDFIEKPFREQVLLDRIQQAIGMDARRRNEAAQRNDVAARYQLLTPKERQVMKLLVQGKPIKTVAAELNLSAKTVHFHRANILEKMRADTLAELTRLALMNRLIDPG